MAEITAEESFLIQAHALSECLFKLGELEAAQDPIILDNSDQIFGQTAKILKDSHGKAIFRGQGTLISVFYMFLVLPLEWKKKRIGDFDQFDLSDAESVANAKADVKKDTYEKKDQALTHFRNALAHGRIGWNNETGGIVVKDQDDHRGCKYTAEYSMEGLGKLAQSLNMAIANYITRPRPPKG